MTFHYDVRKIKKKKKNDFRVLSCTVQTQIIKTLPQGIYSAN